MSPSPEIISWRSSIIPVDLQVYMPAFTHSWLFRRCDSSQFSYRACRTHDIRCLASKKRGFGTEPLKKKSDKSKVPKQNIRSTSEPSKLISGTPKTRTQKAPELITGVDRNSSNVVLDRQFLEKVEAVRRSARELKKAEDDKSSLAIDYDAPIEPDQSTIGLGTKVGVGIAVVVFGLVFAFGDFLPSTSVGPSDESAVVQKQLTDEEKATLKGAAVTLAELGEYEKASSLLDKLTKERPNDIEAYRLLGEVKYEMKDFEGSATAYRNSLSASDGNNFEALRGLTNALLAAKKPSEAVQVLLSAREKLNGGSPEASDILTDANSKMVQNMQKIDPIQLLKPIIYQFPKNIYTPLLAIFSYTTFFLLVKLHHNFDEFGITIKVELLLGKAYSDWGHVSDAVAVYDQLITKYPNDFRGYLAKGIILKENGKVGDAERMFIQAKFFAPDKAKALVYRYSR